jgi:hypothetical protein
MLTPACERALGQQPAPRSPGAGICLQGEEQLLCLGECSNWPAGLGLSGWDEPSEMQTVVVADTLLDARRAAGPLHPCGGMVERGVAALQRMGWAKQRRRRDVVQQLLRQLPRRVSRAPQRTACSALHVLSAAWWIWQCARGRPRPERGA